MRLKPVPPAPDSLDYLSEVRRAVPLTPGSETDCCQRLMNRAGVPAQDDAKAWLTFLRALDLASETSEGKFVRPRESPDLATGTLADRFVERVYGAREVLEILSEDGPLSAEEAFERYRPSIPEWERQRHEEWETIWRERIGHLLDWAALLDLAERSGTEYHLTDAE